MIVSRIKDKFDFLFGVTLLGFLLIALSVTYKINVILYGGLGIIVLEIAYVIYLYKNPFNDFFSNSSSTTLYSSSRSKVNNQPIKTKKKNIVSQRQGFVTIKHIATELNLPIYDVTHFMANSNMTFPSNLDYRTKIKLPLAVELMRRINNDKSINNNVKKKVPQVSNQNELENKQWNIIEIAEHLNMTMYDVQNFAINHSNMGFKDLTRFTKIEYNKALGLVRKLKKYKNENMHEISLNTSKAIEASAPKKKKKSQPPKTPTTTIKAISTQLNMPIQEVIDYAYKSKMGFKNLNAETKVKKPQATGLINKIKNLNTSAKIESPAPKKKKKSQPSKTPTTTIKAVSTQLNIPIQEVIDYAYSSDMGFKNLNAETKINKPQATGLIKKIQKWES